MIMFNTITVETAALCNRSCVFCPNHTTTRPDEYMPLELIAKVLKELGDIKYTGRLETFIYNEPTRDKRLIQILEMAKQLCPGARPAMNTNGDYFKGARDIEKLFDAGLCQLVVNIYSAADGVGTPEQVKRGIANAEKRRHQVIRWLTDVPDVDIDNNVYNRVPRSSRHARVEAKYGVTPATQKIGAQFEVTNRSGLIQWFAKPLAQPLEKMCVKPWRIFNINWKGDALICCNDYHGTESVGNIRSNTVMQLWNSPRMNAYRMALQNKRRDTPLCAKCDDNGGYYQHMIQRVPEKKTLLKSTGRKLIQETEKFFTE